MAGFKVGGDGSSASSGASKEQERAAKQREKDFQNLVASLRTEEEAIAESYAKRRAIIEANTADGSAQRADLLARLEQDHAAQLEKIQVLGKEIEKVFHVQQMVDGTLKAVTTTEEFKTTLASLRQHIEKSDALIREVAKPRTIRLVEQQT